MVLVGKDDSSKEKSKKETNETEIKEDQEKWKGRGKEYVGKGKRKRKQRLRMQRRMEYTEERKMLYRKEEDRKGNGTKKERSKSVGKKSIIHQEEDKFRKGVGKVE